MVAKYKTPDLQQAGTARDIIEAREARALEAARLAVDGMADDPEALRLFIGMVAILGARSLRGL